MATKDVVTVERTINASPQAIFDLLSDPNRHSEIDGSGTVKGARGGSQKLALGSLFGMSMRLGFPYGTENEVVEFDEPRRIAWQTRGTGIVRMFGGRIWRYELEPVESGTLVKESWDITHENALSKPMVRMAAATTTKNMTATLERIEKLVTA
ncbi:MAG TPA: SRPBCC family protein [Acidimicrobiales bacterium]|nr:SRPBCC family protein [Acidimicrobiales bacterium]